MLEKKLLNKLKLIDHSIPPNIVGCLGFMTYQLL